MTMYILLSIAAAMCLTVSALLLLLCWQAAVANALKQSGCWQRQLFAAGAQQQQQKAAPSSSSSSSLQAQAANLLLLLLLLERRTGG
jgi:hypothetical protein